MSLAEELLADIYDDEDEEELQEYIPLFQHSI